MQAPGCNNGMRDAGSGTSLRFLLSAIRNPLIPPPAIPFKFLNPGGGIQIFESYPTG